MNKGIYKSVNSHNELVHLKNNNVKELNFEHCFSISIFESEINNYLMINETTINVEVKPTGEVISLKLYLKRYAKEDNLLYIWRTMDESDFYLEIYQHSDNYIYPEDIYKDTQIITSKEKIIKQLMEKIPVF